METASELIEQAKAARAWLRLTRAPEPPARAPAQPQPTLTIPPSPELSAQLLAELNSPPKHRLYSEIMKKHDAIHPRRQPSQTD